MKHYYYAGQPTPCSAKYCQSKKYATRLIFIGNKGYGICDDCFKWLRIGRQLILNDYDIEDEDRVSEGN